MPLHDHGDHLSWDAPGARAVFTTRDGGVSPEPWASRNVGAHVGDDPERVLENRRRVAALLGLDPAAVAGVTQVHGADVWLDLAPREELPMAVRWDGGASPIEADALVTTRLDAALAVGIADCCPIAIAFGDAVAAVHAGWRSLAGGVLEATMAVLRRTAGTAIAFDGVEPHAAIGPCIGACCMEVGEEVAARFDPASSVRRPGSPRPFLDQPAEARRRLEALGCVVEQVEACTAHEPRWFSHRGDAGRTGRQALLVRRIGSDDA